jgi:protein TonB
LSVYRLPSPYERPPLGRRLSSFGLALAINLALLLILMTLGVIPPPGQKDSHALVVDLVPESRSASPTQSDKAESRRARVDTEKPMRKPPPIVLPAKPTIASQKPSRKTQPWIEMSKEELAAADISKLAATGSASSGDSEAVGRGPNGEVLYAAQWARKPTDAEISGYWPQHVTGWGLVACKTIPGDRVEDCMELDQSPPGSHLASAVRQAAWQFRVRPPRKNGRELIGAWVRILIEIYPAEG